MILIAVLPAIVELKIFASPARLEVIVGFLAIFECFVEVNVLDKLEWSRDYEPLLHNKVISKHVKVIESNHR